MVRVVLGLVDRLRVQWRTFVAVPNAVANRETVAFDLNDNDPHLRVNENDVGLMILCRASEADVGDDHPIAIESPDERLDNDPFGVVLQRLHWKICRDQLSHFRLRCRLLPAERATCRNREKGRNEAHPRRANSEQRKEKEDRRRHQKQKDDPEY